VRCADLKEQCFLLADLARRDAGRLALCGWADDQDHSTATCLSQSGLVL
jgi:hypothetical protein